MLEEIKPIDATCENVTNKEMFKTLQNLKDKEYKNKITKGDYINSC